uniref:Mediator of RNA polymerase II transcription subunit 9 n=1 Tax=Falco tinnunculus TaxID=100819 RepID=A0A8C4XN24_FALTI
VASLLLVTGFCAGDQQETSLPQRLPRLYICLFPVNSSLSPGCTGNDSHPRGLKGMDKDSQDVHQVLNELKNKFQEMRKLISSMPGIGVSPEQQQQQLQNLREQVRTKNELLQKYKSLCMFEIPKE